MRSQMAGLDLGRCALQKILTYADHLSHGKRMHLLSSRTQYLKNSHGCQRHVIQAGDSSAMHVLGYVRGVSVSYPWRPLLNSQRTRWDTILSDGCGTIHRLTAALQQDPRVLLRTCWNEVYDATPSGFGDWVAGRPVR